MVGYFKFIDSRVRINREGVSMWYIRVSYGG